MLGPEMSTQKNHGKPPSFKQKGKPLKTAKTKTKQKTQKHFPVHYTYLTSSNTNF